VFPARTHLSRADVNPLDEIARTPEGWWVLKNDTHLSRWVEEGKRLDHDTPVLGILDPFIRPGSTVIDVGAAIGDHTLFYLKKTGPDGKVIAIEPHPIQYECLIRNCPQADSYSYALGDKRETVFLFMQPDIVAGSRLIDPELQWPGRWVEKALLDDLPFKKDQVSLIKIDVEGCEPEVLRGGRETILASRPAIWLEINPIALGRQGHTVKEIQDFFSENDYEVARSYPDGAGWDGYQGAQCDMLVLPHE
jgi:FkbM family methyltransferase